MSLQAEHAEHQLQAVLHSVIHFLEQQLALGLGGEAVQVHGVVAHHQVCEKRGLLARAGNRAEGL